MVGLADVIEAALTRPTQVTGLTEIEARLEWRPGRETECALALAGLDALLYSRPDLVGQRFLDRLLALVQARSLPDRIAREAMASLGFLATTDLGGAALRGVLGALARGALVPGARQALPGLLQTYGGYRLDAFDLQDVLSVSRSPHAADAREALLNHVVEPLIFRAPERLTPALVDDLQAVFGACARFPYALCSLGSRAGTPPQVKALVRARLAGRLPRRALAATVLRRRPYRLLVVVNARIGQGDEIINVVPLAQALLDANPSATVTLLTRRTYLYDHPRAVPTSITDRAAVGQALEAGCDALLDIFDQNVAEFAWDPAIESALDGLVASRRPRLVLKRDLIRNDFAYRVVAVHGRDMARRWKLDRQLFWNVYEAGQRLLAEMGLPYRAGEEVPGRPSLLVGTRSLEAEACWERLTGRPAASGRRADGRPVAVVNPFGGAEANKGYLPRQETLLAEDLSAVVREGYFALVLLNGSPWASRDVMDRVLARMDAAARRNLAVAPDPAGSGPVMAESGERPDLSHPDRVMRLLKYFAGYADLVVTVEGWLGHLSHQLGSPFRLIPTPGSYRTEWHPHLRRACQQVVHRMSPLAPDRAEAALLGRDDPPPFPFPPRNLVLQAVLRAIGLADGGRLVALLRRALASEDPEIRAAAVSGLGEVRPAGAVKGDLIAMLRDPVLEVRAAAAESLLRPGHDCRAELGPSYRDALETYAALGRFDATAILPRGAAALPAVLAAVTDPGAWRRGWARAILVRLLAELGVRTTARPAEVPSGGIVATAARGNA